MRRILGILVIAFLGLCLVAATQHPNKQHPNKKVCTAIGDGLERAYDLSKWVNDKRKAEELNKAFAPVHFYGLLLTRSVENGASIESTQKVQREFREAGLRFLEQAKTLGVEIPTDQLQKYLADESACSEPY